MPSRIMSGQEVPVIRWKSSALRKARASRRGALVAWSLSTWPALSSRCGTPSISLVTTVSVTFLAR